MILFRQSVFAVAAAVCLAASLAAPAPAMATAFCQLKPTRDGFVALRARPEPTAPLIGRMSAQDEVQMLEGRKGAWIRVLWWRSDDRLTKGHDHSAGSGWMHRNLLVPDSCG